MPTAQMTQAMPRMVNDVHPPASVQPSTPMPSIQAQVVNDLQVQNQGAKPTGFNPIMSAEHHDSNPAIDHVLNQASHAVHSQDAKPETKKGLFGRNKTTAQSHSTYQPKPILETVLLIIGCLIACAIVAVMFSSS